jgi:hypothetical protein
VHAPDVLGQPGGAYVEKTIQIEKRAAGGPVAAGMPYLVNESAVSAPEWFVPSMDGFIMNKQQAQSAMNAGGTTVIQANDIYSPDILDRLEDLTRLMEDLPMLIGVEIEKRK